MITSSAKGFGYAGIGLFVCAVIAVIITLSVIFTRKKKDHTPTRASTMAPMIHEEPTSTPAAWTPATDVDPATADLYTLAFAIMQGDVTTRTYATAYYGSAFKTAFVKAGLSIPTTPSPKWNTGTGRSSDIVMTLKDQAEAQFGADGAVIAQAAALVYNIM